MRAIIVADGDVSGLKWRSETWFGADVDDHLVIAADGGALKAMDLGISPHVVVGDADSLTPQQLADLRSRGAEVLLHPAHKAQSDTELCIREAVRRGAEAIVIVGAFGGLRIEHAIANLLLLALPELAGLEVQIVHGPSEIRMIGGGPVRSVRLSGEIGDYVSLLPLTERVDGVTTDGLRYPLAGATLEQGRTRGLSNELERRAAVVTAASGRLAVIHTSRAGSAHA